MAIGSVNIANIDMAKKERRNAKRKKLCMGPTMSAMCRCIVTFVCNKHIDLSRDAVGMVVVCKSLKLLF